MPGPQTKDNASSSKLTFDRYKMRKNIQEAWNCQTHFEARFGLFPSPGDANKIGV